MVPANVQEMVWNTLSAIHRHIDACHNPDSPKVWFLPKEPQNLQTWDEGEKRRYISFFSTFVPEEELVAYSRVTHEAAKTYNVPIGHVPHPDDLKYLYADFCSVVSHLLAKYLRRRGHNAEIKAARFVPNERYQFPMLRNNGGSKPLHMARHDPRFGFFVIHAVVVVNETAFDVLSPTFANCGYVGFEQWPYKSQHAHTAGTGTYMSYAKTQGAEENRMSHDASVGAFLKWSGTHPEAVWTRELIREIESIWSLH